jgi:hypothetical protein
MRHRNSRGINPFASVLRGLHGVDAFHEIIHHILQIVGGVGVVGGVVDKLESFVQEHESSRLSHCKCKYLQGVIHTTTHFKCFQFFIFSMKNGLTSGCMYPQKWQNLFPEKKKPRFGHCRTNDPRRKILQHPPKMAKHFPGKHVSPFWALSHADFMDFGRNYFVVPPKNGKTFSWKTRNLDFGTVAQIFSAFWRQIVHFLAWRFWYFYFYDFYVSIYGVVHCGPKKFRKLPSNARFCAKRFRHVHFRTYFLVHFLKLF